MEIVSEGSLECISRPASCDNTRVRESAQLKHSSMGFLEELPPEGTVAPLSFNEEVDSEDDEIISRVESDVFIEDVAGRRTSNDSSVTEQEILEEVINNSGKGTSSSEPVQGHIAQHKLSYAETTSQEPIEMEVQDPKMREGLEKIRKLDNILANKMKREKEVKTQRRQLEKLWREESKHLDVVREQEGHGKLDLGVGHALALGPPNYEDLSEGVESVPVTPVFPTQPIPDEHDNDSAPTPEQGCNSSSDSRIERETEAVDMDDESSKRTRKKKGSNKGGSKGKTQNFVKRNIELAADAGNVIPMTEAEKKRLEELLSDDTDLLMVENAFTEGLAIPDGQGFTMDSDAMSSLSEIDSKLQDLVPKEEIDLLMSQDNWKLLEQSDTSSQIGTSVKDFDNIGLGERILREEKEMREMKQRLEAIELQLHSLYRENNDESEGLVSEEILAKLIGGSSRTTSRSTTVSESVLSALSSARTVKEPYGEEIQLTLQMSDCCASRSNSKLSLL